MTRPLMHGVTLVLGGARSGKTAFAEGLVLDTGGPATYLATAEARDGEMADRIARHRHDRGDRWSTVEEPLDLVDALLPVVSREGAVLVDCLTLWVSNLMAADRDVDTECRRLADAAAALDGRVVMVSNEVGLGIVPDNQMARAFRDHAGRLHQMIAAAATDVYFLAAGLPLAMKQG